MNREQSPAAILESLLSRWCEGERDAALGAEISQFLREHPELAWDYLCYMELHASLRAQGLDLVEPEVEPAGASAPVVREGRALLQPGRRLKAALALAAAIAVMALIAIPIARGPAPLVARLASAFEPRWSDASPARNVGDALRRGDTLDLAAGLVRIEFDSGAVATLHGPACLVLDRTNGAWLRRGTVTSEVPERARGFTIDTASSRIIDFGTEFGVAVDPAGATAVSVFQGEVELARRHDGQTPARRLTAGQAIRLGPAGAVDQWREVASQPFTVAPAEGGLPVEVRRFRHAGELEFPDQVIAAVNVGGAEAVEVAGIRFEADRGELVTSPERQDPWGTRPWFGNAPEDRNLSTLLASVRHNLPHMAWVRARPDLASPIRASLPVEPGTYRVTLLLSENYHAREFFRDRSINVDIEGRPCVRDLRVLAVQGIAGHPVPPNQAIRLACQVDVSDGALDLRLFSRDVEVDVDTSAILNALVIERIR